MALRRRDSAPVWAQAPSAPHLRPVRHLPPALSELAVAPAAGAVAGAAEVAGALAVAGGAGEVAVALAAGAVAGGAAVAPTAGVDPAGAAELALAPAG